MINEFVKTGISLNEPISLITHQAIESEFRDYLDQKGYSDLKTLHYFGQRGSNDLEDRKVLVLLGCPIPNVDYFKDEAQAFFLKRHLILKDRKLLQHSR